MIDTGAARMSTFGGNTSNGWINDTWVLSGLTGVPEALLSVAPNTGQPGQTITLADITGPGVIQHIWCTVLTDGHRWIALRVYYDDQKHPSIERPLGDFFSNGLDGLALGNFAQIRYTNTQLDSLTFVDHLGGERPVNPRNDFSFNRDLLTFTGYAFDPNLKFNLILWSSGSLASTAT